MTPEEKLAKQIDEHSLMFEKWKKTSEKISLEEFKEAIKEFRNQTKDSTELLGKNVSTGADKTTFNLIASRNAFTSVLLWRGSWELYTKRFEKE